MDALAVFLFAFVTEILATACSVAISRNNIAIAIVFHNVYTLTMNSSIYIAIGDRDLLLFSGMAEAIGGTLTLYLAESKSGPLHNWAKRGRVRLTEYGNSLFRRQTAQKRKQKPRKKKELT